MRFKVRIFLFLLILALPLLGCGKKEVPSDPVVAKVNHEAIYASDLEGELALKKANNPLFRVTPHTFEDQLQTVIDKRLLIQEAKKQRLDEKERFIHSIKLYWEQTLIRDLVKLRGDDLSRTLEISEKEMRDYYDRLSYQVTLGIVKRKAKGPIEKLLNVPIRDIQWDEEIGPIVYEDVTSDVIARAFDMPESEWKIFQEGGEYYFIYIKKKVRLMIAPFEQMTDEIRKKVRDKKVQRLFREWFDDVKKASEITVNQKALQELQYKHG